MEKRTRLSNVLIMNFLALLLAGTLIAGLILSQAEAAPPSGTTYWLVTGHPDTAVFHEIQGDPDVGFELNWIVLEMPDGTLQPFDQNCKVVYVDAVTGEITRVEYYGNDYIVAAESMGGFAPPAMDGMAVAE